MTRLEALQAAEAYVAKATDAPINDRGYPVNGWQRPLPEVRLKLVLQVAAFLLDEASS